MSRKRNNTKAAAKPNRSEDAGRLANALSALTEVRVDVAWDGSRN